MKSIQEIVHKKTKLVIGLMSGTSADGLDAALTEIDGCGLQTRVRQLAFVSLPYDEAARREILRLAGGKAGGSHDLCLFHFWLGHASLEACRAVCRQAGVMPDAIDLVGSHGQTLYHIPVPENYLGHSLAATLQLGEASVIAEGLGCPVISDFRVRDMAAGGLGAPLVPYAEYLIYSSGEKTVGLQNIGGIANLTVLPRGGQLADTFAFDTGPGNMVMDQLTERITSGRLHYDENGALAAQGKADADLLQWMLGDPYLKKAPPKTTGRESYGEMYVSALMQAGKERGLAALDILATATRFTAECIGIAVENFCPVQPDELVVGGGGSRNPVLMACLRARLSIPVLTNEDLGYDSDAKEAVAFAVLANECLHGLCNNVPSVTGARHPVVMGKISQ